MCILTAFRFGPPSRVSENAKPHDIFATAEVPPELRTGIRNSGDGDLLDADGLLSKASADPKPTTRSRAPGHHSRTDRHLFLMQSGGPSQSICSTRSPGSESAWAKASWMQVESFQPGSQSSLLMGGGFKFRKRPMRNGVQRAGAAYRWVMTTSAWSDRCTATTTIIPRPCAASTPARSSPAGRRSARG